MSFRLHILPFDRDVDCAPGETILAAALRAGLYVPYGCKTGGCSSCRMRLVEGEVEGASLALAPEDREAGWFLPCVSRPRADCAIDVGETGIDERTFLAGDRATAFTTVLEGNQRVTPDIHAIRLRLVEPATIRFSAGQFVHVEVPASRDVRTYSIASPPSQADALDLYVQRRPQGRFSALLESGLAPGTRLRVFGPFGGLRVRLTHRPILMVASGAGLAPMLSMLNDLVEKGNTRPVRLFFRARSMDDVFAQDQLRAIGRAMPGFRYTPVLLGAGEFPSDALAPLIGHAGDHDAYIGGSPLFIESTLPVLLDLGVRRRNVHFDVFTPAV